MPACVLERGAVQSRQEALIHLRQQAGLHSPLPCRQPPQSSPLPSPIPTAHWAGTRALCDSDLQACRAQGRWEKPDKVVVLESRGWQELKADHSSSSFKGLRQSWLLLGLSLLARLSIHRDPSPAGGGQELTFGNQILLGCSHAPLCLCHARLLSCFKLQHTPYGPPWKYLLSVPSRSLWSVRSGHQWRSTRSSSTQSPFWVFAQTYTDATAVRHPLLPGFGQGWQQAGLEPNCEPMAPPAVSA